MVVNMTNLLDGEKIIMINERIGVQRNKLEELYAMLQEEGLTDQMISKINGHIESCNLTISSFQTLLDQLA